MKIRIKKLSVINYENNISEMRKTALIGLLLLIITLLSVIGLFWIALTIVLYTLLYFGILKIMARIQKKSLERILKRVFVFLMLFSTIIGVKLFAFNIFKIPSSSMENQLFTNDVIVVNKLKYGPRLPRSPFDIPWINIAFYFNDGAKKRIKEHWWSYKRLSGTTAIKQGEVMVFNSTWDKNFILVKRCVALPGDTLTIENGKVYTNNNLFAEPNSIKNSSTNSQSKRRNKKLFFQEFEDWNYTNMGPFVMPKKGMTISLNDKNFKLYKKTIQLGEKTKIHRMGTAYYINNRLAETYTFKQDYYFMMGDNRDFTEDSRVWGFVPEQNMIGKVDRILFSKYGGSFNWDRFLKTVY